MMMHDMMEMLECIIYNMVYITNNYMYMYEMVISEIYNQHHRNHHVYNNHPHNTHQDHH